MDVITILQQAPAQLAYHARQIQETMKLHDTAKHHLRVARARARIAHKGERNQTLINAYCDADEEVTKGEVEVIGARANLEIARINWHEWDDKWMSARKIAGIDETELKALRGQVVRPDVYRDEKTGHIMRRSTGEVIDEAPQQ